jgi:hypothetical protein
MTSPKRLVSTVSTVDVTVTVTVTVMVTFFVSHQTASNEQVRNDAKALMAELDIDRDAKVVVGEILQTVQNHDSHLGQDIIAHRTEKEPAEREEDL